MSFSLDMVKISFVRGFADCAVRIFTFLLSWLCWLYTMIQAYYFEEILFTGCSKSESFSIMFLIFLYRLDLFLVQENWRRLIMIIIETDIMPILAIGSTASFEVSNYFLTVIGVGKDQTLIIDFLLLPTG